MAARWPAWYLASLLVESARKRRPTCPRRTRWAETRETRGRSGGRLNDAASGSRQDIVPRKKGSYNASTAGPAYYTPLCSNGGPRSINGPARTLIIRAFSSGLSCGRASRKVATLPKWRNGSRSAAYRLPEAASRGSRVFCATSKLITLCNLSRWRR